MQPIRLELKNFLAYRSPDPLRFDGIHLACLTGANGAGKSSLLDAITWVLWGKARARRDEELVHLGQNDMYVQLDFEHEGGHFRVLRQRTRKSGGQGRLEFFSIGEDGTPRTLNAGSIRATQNAINKLLRLDYETFVSSAFLQQGRADTFTIKTPAERKRILSDILGLDRWTRYEDEVKARLKTINETISGIDAIIHDIEHELAQEPGLLQAVKEAETVEQEARATLQVAEASRRELEGSPNDLRNAQNNKAAQERSIKNRKSDIAAVEEDIARHQRRIDEFEAIINQRDEIEEGYATLQAAREADHSLGAQLIELQAVKDEIGKLETRLNDTRAELKSEISGYQATIAQLEHTVGGANPDALSEARARVLELEALETRREELRELESTLKSEQSGLRATNSALKTEMNELRDRIDRLEAAEGAAECPLCGQPLTEDHRAAMIAELTAEGTARGDEYRGNESRMNAIKGEIQANTATIKDLAGELAELPALKEDVGRLQAAVDEAHQAETRLNETQARLDAVQQMLDNEDFAHDLREQLAALNEQREALGYDDTEHKAAREQLEVYREYEARQTRLEIALNSVEDQREDLAAAQAKLDRHMKALADEEAQFETLDLEIARLEQLVEEYHVREAEVLLQRTREREAHERLIVAKQELDSLDAQRDRKARLEAQREEHQRNRALHAELQLAFSKNGIPAMIIETAIPELETGANDILTRMTDGRMHIRLETQKEKVTGGVAETLDIHIADELGTRSYEMYSGGEAFRINFALRVALSQLLARRAGAHLQTLFIDEGFGTQDEEGRARLVEAITAVQDSFELILVITHIDELRDSFPVHIMLEKTSDGSRISVR